MVILEWCPLKWRPKKSDYPYQSLIINNMLFLKIFHINWEETYLQPHTPPRSITYIFLLKRENVFIILHVRWSQYIFPPRTLTYYSWKHFSQRKWNWCWLFRWSFVTPLPRIARTRTHAGFYVCSPNNGWLLSIEAYVYETGSSMVPAGSPISFLRVYCWACVNGVLSVA